MGLKMDLSKVLRSPIDAAFEGATKLENNMGTKGLLAVLMVGTACFMAFNQIPLPSWMTNGVQLVIAMYYAGSYALTGVKK